MRSLLKINDNTESANPLDDLEEVLESSSYDFSRLTKNRLNFVCEGRQTEYSFFLEWHDEHNAIKCSVVINETVKISEHIIDTAIEKANEVAWHGFFMRDGVGHVVFKSLVKLPNDKISQSLLLIEETIDKSMGEVDRFCLSLSISKDGKIDELFPDDDIDIENMVLMFSEPVGNA